MSRTSLAPSTPSHDEPRHDLRQSFSPPTPQHFSPTPSQHMSPPPQQRQAVPPPPHSSFAPSPPPRGASSGGFSLAHPSSSAWTNSSDLLPPPPPPPVLRSGGIPTQARPLAASAVDSPRRMTRSQARAPIGDSEKNPYAAKSRREGGGVV
jgi:programmed cell death 6-interacting protein